MLSTCAGIIRNTRYSTWFNIRISLFVVYQVPGIVHTRYLVPGRVVWCPGLLLLFGVGLIFAVGCLVLRCSLLFDSWFVVVLVVGCWCDG